MDNAKVSYSIRSIFRTIDNYLRPIILFSHFVLFRGVAKLLVLYSRLARSFSDRAVILDSSCPRICVLALARFSYTIDDSHFQRSAMALAQVGSHQNGIP